MTSYRVVPNDGNWKVMKARSNGVNHRTVSNHRTKRAAKRNARRKASNGDKLTILRSDGAIQNKVTVQ